MLGTQLQSRAHQNGQHCEAEEPLLISGMTGLYKPIWENRWILRFPTQVGVQDDGFPILSVDKPGWWWVVHTCNDIYKLEPPVKEDTVKDGVLGLGKGWIHLYMCVYFFLFRDY